jgi:hypothetical protein
MNHVKALSLFLSASVKPAAITDPNTFLDQWSAPLRSLGFAVEGTDTPIDKLTSIRTQVIAILRADTQANKGEASAASAPVKAKGDRKPKGLDQDKPIVRVYNDKGEVVKEFNAPTINEAEKAASRRLFEAEPGFFARLSYKVCGEVSECELNRDDAIAMILTDHRPATAFRKTSSGKGNLNQPWMREPATTKARFSKG